MSLTPLTIVSAAAVAAAAALDVEDGEEQVVEWVKLHCCGNVAKVFRFCGSVDFICVELTIGEATSLSNFDVTIILLICVSVISSSLASIFFDCECIALESIAVLSTVSLLFSCELVIALRRLRHSAVEKLLAAVDSLDVIS